MPAMGTSTTEVFSDLGLTASDIYGVFTGLIGTAVDFSLWLIQVSWPFLLGAAFIYLMIRLASKFLMFK